MGARLTNSKAFADASIEKKDFNSKYTLGQTIGQGSFGKILEAQQCTTFRTVAIKFIKKKSVDHYLNFEGHILPSEVVFLQTANHPNIISLVDLYEFNNRYALVMERPLASMDLWKFVNKYGPQNDSVVSFVTHQILKTMLYLHQCEIFHRDLKSGNILIDCYSYNIKVIDFGCSCIIDKDVFSGHYGTPEFCPPEWFNKPCYRPEPTNIWAIGIITYEMLTGGIPFNSPQEVMSCRLSFPDHVSHSAKDFVRSCLKLQEHDRFSYHEALAHQLITEEPSPDENSRILDESTYSKCSAYTVVENPTARCSSISHL